MKRIAFACLGFCFVFLLTMQGARAQEKAEQVRRDVSRLDQIKKIALVPVVIQLRFDQDKRIPDPGRMAARQAVVLRLPMLLQDGMKSEKYELLLPEAATLAVRELGWQATDLYKIEKSATWDSPAEVIRNKKGDEAALLQTREIMKTHPEAMTLFRYHWHDLPETVYGLASFKLNSSIQVEESKAKALAEKLGADALLFCQVGDMEVHTGETLFENFKSTRIHLYATLISVQDGAILWQARARGIHSHKAGFFTGARAYQSEEGMAIEGAMQAVKTLLDDLYHGTGNPVPSTAEKPVAR